MKKIINSHQKSTIKKVMNYIRKISEYGLQLREKQKAKFI